MNQQDASTDQPNDQSDGIRSHGRSKRFGGKSAGAIAVAILVAGYSFAQPKLNDRFGWNLPGIRQTAHGQVVLDEPSTKSPKTSNQNTPKQTPLEKVKPSTAKEISTKKPTTASGKPKSGGGPLAGRMKSATSRKDPAPTSERKPSSVTKGTDNGLLYGLLKEVGPKRYISKAGLYYGPGSAEGHRLEHLRRHLKDDRSRPIHGVFDGEMEGALKTIDSAYERAKKKQRTTKKVEDGRTIYTVDMGKRIGFVGGRAGQQKRNPMARRVRLVLDGNKVITAFPQ